MLTRVQHGAGNHDDTSRVQDGGYHLVRPHLLAPPSTSTLEVDTEELRRVDCPLEDILQLDDAQLSIPERA